MNFKKLSVVLLLLFCAINQVHSQARIIIDSLDVHISVIDKDNKSFIIIFDNRVNQGHCDSNWSLMEAAQNGFHTYFNFKLHNSKPVHTDSLPYIIYKIGLKKINLKDQSRTFQVNIN